MSNTILIGRGCEAIVTGRARETHPWGCLVTSPHNTGAGG